MAAFEKSNICWCTCQPNSYREIQKKLQNYCALNVKNECKLTGLQNFRDLLVENKPRRPQVGDKDAYEICCSRRKRKPENIQEVKKFTGRGNRSILPDLKSHSYDKPTIITQKTLTFAQRPAIIERKKPKWHEEHEKMLKERAKEQSLEKQKILMQNLNNKSTGLEKFQRLFDFNKAQNVRRNLQWEQKKDSPYQTSSRTVKPETELETEQKHDKQNMIKKREGLDKFQRLFDLNKAQNIRGSLQWEQRGNNPYYNSSKAVKTKSAQEKKHPKSSSVNSERAFVKQFANKPRPSKDREKIRFQTPLDKYQESKKRAGKPIGVQIYLAQCLMKQLLRCPNCTRL
ncbi:hypothetical protein M5D96_009621 [Drosophila gunungcola]|uniref:Uncharacterized protein n=1 Tax=Drosophila gunungcola TaxID=103775 RepID=A0A9P9YIY5_9MUSC|nr:hypothetical protein M5D96_009621 [Drosophila gunungcola]